MRRLGPRAPVLLALAVASALAQQPRPPAAPQPPPPAEEAPPPYEPQLLRLAEIMGALSHLRDLCGMGDGGEWRQRMAALIATEGATPARRERLAGAFNRGFRGYEQTTRTCTPSAAATIERFVEEGGRLARDLANRFSG